MTRSSKPGVAAILVAGLLGLAGPLAAQATAPVAQRPAGPRILRGNAAGEWRYWGADAWSSRYSPLDQINASNFDSLQLTWKWNAAELGPDEYYRTTPLYANGRLFTVATTHRYAFALDPATGKELWQWTMDEGIRYQKAPRQFAGRGLSYWTDGAAERIIVVTPGYHMAALDARTGKPDPKFGKDGVVDLMDGLGLPLVPLAVDDSGAFIISDAAPYRRAWPGEKWDPVKKIGADGTIGVDPGFGQVANSSPAIIVNDVIVVGNSSIHGYYPIRFRNIPGTIRGFDIRTGKQLWKFNLVPQPGEFGAETWTAGSLIGTEGVGKNDAWATYSADPALGLAYIPVGMPLLDEYGGHRPGANLFGNTVVALDVKTGKRKWHYQFVHHDIWDYDTPMSPNLLDVTIAGRPRKIIAQTTKQGWVYVLDRVTGEPIWPIVETAVMASDVPGEQAWATQPIPTKPAPFSQQGLVEADIIDYTPAIRDSAMKLATRCRMGPYYIPAATTDTSVASQHRCSWYAPGASGGVNIDGGAAVDPETGLMFVGSQTGLSTIQVQKDPCSEFRYSSPHDSCGLLGALNPPAGYVKPRAGAGGGVGAGRGANPSAIAGISIAKPKEYGGITAYDLKSGDKAWWIPNGVWVQQQVPDSVTLFRGVKLPPVSGRGQAQIIVTKSLLIYGTGRNGQDSIPMLYAVDKATGKQVGAVKIADKRTSLIGGTTAVPMTFLHQGKQYIVFATGQTNTTALIGFALPGGRKTSD